MLEWTTQPLHAPCYYKQVRDAVKKEWQNRDKDSRAILNNITQYNDALKELDTLIAKATAEGIIPLIVHEIALDGKTILNEWYECR